MPFDGFTINGEDEKAMIRHIALLKVEMNRVVPNKEVVKELMKTIFVKRRSDILNCQTCVTETSKNYPSLRCPLQVHAYNCVF